MQKAVTSILRQVVAGQITTALTFLLVFLIAPTFELEGIPDFVWIVLCAISIPAIVLLVMGWFSPSQPGFVFSGLPLYFLLFYLLRNSLLNMGPTEYGFYKLAFMIKATLFPSVIVAIQAVVLVAMKKLSKKYWGIK